MDTGDWVKEQSQMVPLQSDELQARRTKGSYRLSDFIIQRTLGTGSFGRVHLGEYLPMKRPWYLHILSVT